MLLKKILYKLENPELIAIKYKSGAESESGAEKSESDGGESEG